MTIILGSILRKNRPSRSAVTNDISIMVFYDLFDLVVNMVKYKGTEIPVEVEIKRIRCCLKDWVTIILGMILIHKRPSWSAVTNNILIKESKISS